MKRRKHCDGCRCGEPVRRRVMRLEHEDGLAGYGDHDDADRCHICMAYRWGRAGLDRSIFFHIPGDYAPRMAYQQGRDEHLAVSS